MYSTESRRLESGFGHRVFLDALMVEETTSGSLLPVLPGLCYVIRQISFDLVAEIIHAAELNGLLQQLVHWYYWVAENELICQDPYKFILCTQTLQIQNNSSK